MRIFYLIIFCFFSCYDKNRIDSWEIQKRVGILIEAKAVQCGNRPPVPLFFTLDKPPGEVERCELDVIGLRCPFRNYPWSCVRIF
jgi:hypothetical protein